jgi:hypothetical protein
MAHSKALGLIIFALRKCHGKAERRILIVRRHMNMVLSFNIGLQAQTLSAKNRAILRSYQNSAWLVLVPEFGYSGGSGGGRSAARHFEVTEEERKEEL